MKKIVITAFILMSCHVFAQISNVEEKFDLPTTLSESSGAIFFNDKLILHNDSGNQNQLYELDTISGLVTRIITITNATNVDWEDIAQDDTSIFIGDIGNNNGDRTDLKIYKINKTEYVSADAVMAEIINFSYEDQLDFTPSPNNTTWDSEALISFDANSLILFTKNWVNGTTKAYTIPKSAGTFTIEALPATLASGGLITGATFNPLTEKVYLVGYNSVLQPFVWVSENFVDNDVFSGTNSQTLLPSLGFEQAEAITHIGANQYFITSETFSIGPISDTAKLVSFTTNDSVLSMAEHSSNLVRFYPNPVQAFLYVEGVTYTSIEIYDINTALVYRGNDHKIDVSNFNKGLYLVKVFLNNQTYITEKIIKN